METIDYDLSDNEQFEMLFDMSIHQGTIVSVDTGNNKADVEIDGIGLKEGVEIFYHCADGTTDSGATAFKVNDRVLITNEKGKCNPEVENLRIMAFTDELKPCVRGTFNILYGSYLGARIYVYDTTTGEITLENDSELSCAAQFFETKIRSYSGGVYIAAVDESGHMVWTIELNYPSSGTGDTNDLRGGDMQLHVTRNSIYVVDRLGTVADGRLIYKYKDQEIVFASWADYHKWNCVWNEDGDKLILSDEGSYEPLHRWPAERLELHGLPYDLNVPSDQFVRYMGFTKDYNCDIFEETPIPHYRFPFHGAWGPYFDPRQGRMSGNVLVANMDEFFHVTAADAWSGTCTFQDQVLLGCYNGFVGLYISPYDPCPRMSGGYTYRPRYQCNYACAGEASKYGDDFRYGIDVYGQSLDFISTDLHKYTESCDYYYRETDYGSGVTCNPNHSLSPFGRCSDSGIITDLEFGHSISQNILYDPNTSIYIVLAGVIDALSLPDTFPPEGDNSAVLHLAANSENVTIHVNNMYYFPFRNASLGISGKLFFQEAWNEHRTCLMYVNSTYSGTQKFTVGGVDVTDNIVSGITALEEGFSWGNVKGIFPRLEAV